jgi:phytol kinase
MFEYSLYAPDARQQRAAFASVVALPLRARSHAALLRCRHPRQMRCSPLRSVSIASLAPVIQDAAVTAATVGIATSALALLQFATPRFIPSTLTRKLVHIFCAPLAVSLWGLYSDAPTARLAAASVPLLFAARIAFGRHTPSSSSSPGANFTTVETRQVPAFTSLSETLSRSTGASSARLEAMQGPLYYVLFLASATLLLWRTAPAAVAVGQLAFGDGFADVIGRNFGAGVKWPFPRAGSKTVVGSLAFVAAALAGSAGLLSLLHESGTIISAGWSLDACLPALAFTSVACAAVELLLPEIDDNLSVPACAILLSVWLKL